MTLETISITEFTALSSKITMEYLEKMAAAYLLLTNLSPTEVELVQEIDDWNKVVWYFRKRTEDK